MSGRLPNAETLLIGCGKMGMDYAQVLCQLRVRFTAIGNSISGVEKFKAHTGLDALSGGLQAFLATHDLTAAKAFLVIICVPNQAVTCVLEELLRAHSSGVMHVSGLLLEKPIASESQLALKIIDYVEGSGITTFVAFNRRFYPVVQHLKHIIEEEGGVEYVHFEFNEWEERLEMAAAHVSIADVNNWEFTTGCHVIDMAFFLAGGIPLHVQCTSTAGNLPPMKYHAKSAAFGGVATTSTGVLVTWKTYFRRKAPWKVELVTSAKSKYELNPIETLSKYDATHRAENITVSSPKDFLGLRFGLGEMVTEFILKCSTPEYQASESLVTLAEYRIFLERLYSKLCQPPKPVILMVGGGNIAFRYLQGFLRAYEVPPLMYVSDPSKHQLEILTTRLCAEHPLAKDSIFLTSTPLKSVMPKRCNLLLCATSAKHRFTATMDMISKVEHTDMILLEKPSFQRLTDFDELLSATNNQNIPVYSTAGGWIPLSNFFEEVSSWHKQGPEHFTKIKVDGIGWGLCCNSCHFLAMFCLLNNFADGICLGERGFALETNFGKQLVPSKRPGCLDIESGQVKLIHMESGEVVVELRCAPDNTSTSLALQFESKNLSAYYCMGEKTAIISKDKIDRIIDLDVLHTSEAAPKMLKQVVSEGKLKSCMTLQAVSTFEKPLLERFGEHFEACGIDITEGVPIS